MTDGPTEEFDPLFEEASGDAVQSHIFRNKELLEIGHIPDRDRIIGRDEAINEVGNRLRPVVRNETPSSCLIYGQTGTGKTLVARHVADRAAKAAGRQDVAVAVGYVDCSNANTLTQAARSLTASLNDPATTDIRVPETGLGMSQYLWKLWEIVDIRSLDAIVVILDELDRLRGLAPGEEDDDLLMQLTRARESQKTDARIGVIGISNKINYRDRITNRVESSLGNDELVFSPYTATEIRAILAARRDAFREGVLEDDVIPKAAALSGREHGDARRAVRILRNAGEIAESTEADRVTVDQLDTARQRAEVDRVAELVAGTSPHMRYVLLALVALVTHNDPDEYRTSMVYQVYEQVCDQEATDPLSHKRVSDLLDELAFLELTESEHTGSGDSKGAYNVHRLLVDPAVITDYLAERTDLTTDSAGEVLVSE